MMRVPLQTAPQPAKLAVKLASNTGEIEQAMRLRYQVFVEEENNFRMLNERKLESDDFDAYCDHLIVQDLETEEVVGTYRLLPGDRAVEGIGFYSETEFDLSAYAQRKKQSLELGRSCVAPPYRDGRTIQLLWEGIAGYSSENGFSHLIGCASVHFAQMEALNEIYSLLRLKQVWTDRYGIQPLPSYRITGLSQIELSGSEKELFRKLPPLMKGYQWLGAEIAGDPAYDELFGTVDFFIVLEKEKVTRRYKRHFLAT
ncbi:GNAT family N-acetyltransferase [Paenibacillus roseipurpureus]|uniref:GNAT family N-acyltransferase n=1 Tax=Paenibacillus roseopurpureus TaxID=2918901 RepID=A0AA96LIC8_9BACL|nr:GNAT family N-acyltransferase [Paenibacillus sp. MBLB1832]WNR42272.1 GNAT family N-acyltransferase [Paenibacillus sp. MBLB1832]